MIDTFQMLGFLAEREECGPGVPPAGSGLLMEAAGLDEQPLLARNGTVVALRELKRLGWIDLVFQSWPNGPLEPAAHFLGENEIRQASR